MKLIIAKDATSVSVDVFIRDNSVTTGAGLTGLVFNTASLTAYYSRQNAAATAITLATQTATGAFSSGGFVAVDGTNMPGLYRLDIPDAALATGVNTVYIMLKGATNMEPCVLEIELSSVNLQDAVRGGMTAFPNVASGSSGAILTHGTGTAQLKATSGYASMTWADIASPSSTVAFTNTTVASLTNAPTSGDLTSTMKTSVATAALTTQVTEAYRANAAAPTLAQALCEILAHLGEASITGTTKTINKFDHSTSAATFTLNSGTTPTALQRAT